MLQSDIAGNFDADEVSELLHLSRGRGHLRQVHAEEDGQDDIVLVAHKADITFHAFDLGVSSTCKELTQQRRRIAVLTQ
jgi:hypothetical protein